MRQSYLDKIYFNIDRHLIFSILSAFVAQHYDIHQLSTERCVFSTDLPIAFIRKFVHPNLSTYWWVLF